MNTRKRSATWMSMLAGLALLGLVARPAHSGEFDLADHLDPRTSVYITLNDLDSSWDRFPTSPLGKLIASEPIQKFLETLGGAAARQTVEEMRGPGGLPISIAGQDRMPGQVSFALTLPPAGSHEMPRVVGSLCLGEERDALVTVLNALLDQLRGIDPESTQGRLSIVEGQILRLSVLDTTVSYFWSDDSLIFGSRREDLVSVLKSIDEPRDDALATVPRFRALKARTRADEGGMFLYTSLDEFGLKGRPSRSRTDRMFRAFGLTDIRALGLSSRMGEDGRGVSRLRVEMPGDYRGLIDVFGEGTRPFTVANYFPRQSVLSLAARLDAQGVSRLASRLTVAVGFDLQSKGRDGAYPTPWPIDLARALGDEAGIYLAPARMGLMPEMGLIVTLRDPARARHALNRGVSASKGLRIRAFNRRGHRYYRLDPKVTTPLLTSVTIADGVLAAGSSVTVVDGMLQRGALEKARSLGRAKEYRAVVARAPADAAAVLYVDTPRIIRYLHGAFGPMILWAINLSRQNMDGIEPISLADFPSGEDFTRHLGPAVTWLETDEEGLTAVSLSDVQNEITTFSFLAGLGFGFSLVAAEQEKKTIVTPPPIPKREPEKDRHPPRLRDRDEKVDLDRCRLCRTNLRLFHYSFHRYRKTHGGQVPPDIASFFGPGPAHGPPFVSPADEEAQKALKEGREGVISYVYVGPRIPEKVARPDRFLLVWNREAFHRGKRLVLLLDGRIPLVTEEEFQKLLAETKAAIGK